MPKSVPVGPARGKKEIAALLDILAPTFNFARGQGERYSQIVGEKNYRIVRSGKEIAGGCALLPMGQFFGGRSVPMMGVAAVGIAPEHRGQRTATMLMQAVLKEMRAKRWPLSGLYPATLSLYRRAGYEQAGVRYEIRIPAKTMIFPSHWRTNDLQVQRITPKNHAAIEELYRVRAASTAGNLDRSPFIWHRVRSPRGQTAQGFMAVNPATRKPEGYTYYVQKECVEAPYSLHATDLVATTPAAGQRLLSLLADHRSMTHEIIFHGTPDDPIIKLLPERNYSAKLLDHWMLRIVDVKAALIARGYASCVKAQVHFEVTDGLLKQNSGRYVLTVEDGAARVEKGGRGDIQIDIRGLAALYSGHASPNELLAIGLIAPMSRTRKSNEQMELAAAVFAGPAPWMGDMF